MPTLYTVKQSAELLGTSTATVRRIADEFSEHLPDYQPVKGQARKLSDTDLRTIYAIQSRLIDNPALTRADVLRELSEPDTAPLIIPATLPTERPASPQNGPESPITDRAIQTDIASPQNAILPFLQAQDDTRQQIARLSAQIERIAQERPQERQAERRYPVAVITCFVLLLIGVTFSALLSDSRAALAMSFVALVVIAVALVWPSMRR